MPLTPRSNDHNQYNGPRGRRIRRAVVSMINPLATHGARGFDTREECVAHAEKNSPGQYGIGEWPTPFGVDYEWYYPDQGVSIKCE